MPVNWSVQQPIQFASQGLTSGQPYSPSIANCADTAPNVNYSLAGGATAKVLDKSIGDSLTFGFRLGSTTSANGAVIIRLFEQNASGAWVKIDNDVTSSVNVIPSSANVFVASDSAACGENKPCYVNSSDDLPNGLGTGLKDAIDAVKVPATITLLGDVRLKQNAVVVSQPVILKGSGSSRLSYNGLVCVQPMLSITAGATISGLTIDGTCASSSRDLVWVNGADPILIELNDLTKGRNAISTASTNAAALTVRNNQISANTGYAILLDPVSTGRLTAVANNIESNRAGAQVECRNATKGSVDHNYWGAGVLAAAGASNCTVSNDKRLGAAIIHNASTPGVQAQVVTVGPSLQYAFNNSVGFQRGTSGSDFGLYIVNHGSGSTANIPFTAGQAGNLQPCSNYWDIFFANSPGPVDPTTLDLFFKYNLNSACLSSVESAQYCGQTALPSRYPLWWYDLSSGNWLTTGLESGQPTTCHTTTDEIQVMIDGIHGKPGFAELEGVPFVVGIPAQPVSVTFSNLAAQPGNTLATLSWTTSSEINMAGYYVQRSTSSDSASFTSISSLQPRTGSGSGGASYQFTDTNLVNNTQYYYRILVVGYDGSSGVSGVTSVTPIPPTATITLTPSDNPHSGDRHPHPDPFSNFYFHFPNSHPHPYPNPYAHLALSDHHEYPFAISNQPDPYGHSPCDTDGFLRLPGAYRGRSRDRTGPNPPGPHH